MSPSDNDEKQCFVPADVVVLITYCIGVVPAPPFASPFDVREFCVFADRAQVFLP